VSKGYLPKNPLGLSRPVMGLLYLYRHSGKNRIDSGAYYDVDAISSAVNSPVLEVTFFFRLEGSLSILHILKVGDNQVTPKR